MVFPQYQRTGNLWKFLRQVMFQIPFWDWKLRSAGQSAASSNSLEFVSNAASSHKYSWHHPFHLWPLIRSKIAPKFGPECFNTDSISIPDPVIWKARNLVLAWSHKGHQKEMCKARLRAWGMVTWLVVWNIVFFHILGRIIPTDFHILQRGRYITNQAKKVSKISCKVGKVHPKVIRKSWKSSSKNLPIW
jgi:hypothetical protein